MKNIIFVFFGIFLIGCYKVTEIMDVFPSDPDHVDMVDTVQNPIDSIVIEPCTDSLYLEPAFVTGWFYLPETIITDLELCVWDQCVIVAPDTDVQQILKSMLEAYQPSLQFEVFTEGQRVSFISKGTNDINVFNGKVWYRPVPYNSGWGFSIQKQAYAFLGSVTFDEYMAIIDTYPSARYISFRYFDWTADQYIKAALKCLECRTGRDIIDFRGIILNTGEPFTMPDSIVNKAIQAGWDDVRH